MPRLGVVGWPVAHSRSPAMHNAALAHVGLAEWRYQLLPIPPELVSETLRALPASGFGGVNVTLPHKAAAMEVATDPSDRAREIGAANTLVYRGDGTIAADNTDAPALIKSLRRLPAFATALPGNALVLGAGGTARAAVWALRDAGVAHVQIWNRTHERARALADRFGADASGSIGPRGLLVNCTSVGLDGGDPFGQLPVDADRLRGFEAVVDYVYTPAGTRLVDTARRLGLPAVDGLELLVAQGALSFSQFTGCPAPLEVMRRAAREG